MIVVRRDFLLASGMSSVPAGFHPGVTMHRAGLLVTDHARVPIWAAEVSMLDEIRPGPMLVCVGLLAPRRQASAIPAIEYAVTSDGEPRQPTPDEAAQILAALESDVSTGPHMRTCAFLAALGGAMRSMRAAG